MQSTTKLAIYLAGIATGWFFFSCVSTSYIESFHSSLNNSTGSLHSASSSSQKAEEETTTPPITKTLRVQVASDLHIEFYDKFEDDCPEDIILPRAPVLALLGDVGLAFTPQLKAFLHHQAKRFEAVIYIAGNHEFYNHQGASKTVGEQEQWLRDVCSEVDNLHFMEKNVMVINGVRILATTLWSFIPPSVELSAGSSMNDYHLSYVQEKEGPRKLTVADTRQWHVESAQWLKTEIAAANQLKQPVLVLTHHTPSLQGTSDPKYDGDELSYCFSTDLSDLVQDPAVRAWSCGHTHWNFDMMMEEGGTRLVSNQRGYPQRENKLYDNEGIVLEISPNW